MRTRKVAPLVLLTAAALAAAACAAARAEPKPLWEFGLGAGALVFNDYPRADSVHAYPVPVPYLVYRGKFLRSDHNGLRGRLLEQERIGLNLSVNGTTPARSDSSRHGMPDLRATQRPPAHRPGFRAQGGFGGPRFIAGLAPRYPACWLGAYLRHDTLAGASFADSPLIRRDSYWSGGFGIAWIIRRSARLVDSED